MMTRDDESERLICGQSRHLSEETHGLYCVWVQQVHMGIQICCMLPQYVSSTASSAEEGEPEEEKEEEGKEGEGDSDESSDLESGDEESENKDKEREQTPGIAVFLIIASQK